MVAFLVAAQLIVWHGPKLSPEAAARILANSPVLSNKTNDPGPVPDGPTVTVIPGSVTAGPFGEFPRYEPTSWYGAGLPLWGYGGYGGYGYGGYGYTGYSGYGAYR